MFASEVSLAFRLLLLTGARLREILNLEWRHVDFERGVLLLPDSKTGRRTIVLSTFALELLKHCEQRSEFVFPNTKGSGPRTDLRKPWRAIQRHAGLEGVRIHDLRHTFASIRAGANLGLPIVGKLSHRVGGPFHPARKLCDAAVEPRYRFVELANCTTSGERLAHFKRDCLVAGLDQHSQFAGVSWPLRRDHADLGQGPRNPLSSCVRCETNISRVL